jgi:glycosyltransferase involved in cell wall biosynthesis
MKSISIIIPVFNEEENILSLYAEVKTVCKQNNYKYEIIIIDDGSTDNTVEIIGNLCPITLIIFRKNFGQTAALDVGIKKSNNDYIIPMDGDGQNDPKDIPMMIKYLEDNNLDIVSGWRKDRKDSFMKKFISFGARIIRNFLINDGIHDSGCTLKVYKKECFNNVSLFGEMHRFIPALMKIKGYKIGELPVNHRKRKFGITKYSWQRTIKGLLDMISVWFWYKFAVRPFHLLGGLGIIFFIIGIMTGIYNLYLFTKGSDLSDTVYPILTIFLFITGILLFIFGLIADMISKIYHESKDESSYSIDNVITFD